MTPQKKIAAAKIFALVVTIGGCSVIAGWLLNIGFLKSVSPAWISMKFDTAVAFILSGISLYFMARAAQGELDQAQVVLSITTLMIALLMGTLFFSVLFGIQTGAEWLFFTEKANDVKTVFAGRPSLLTMINFFLFISACFMTMLNKRRLRSRMKVVARIVAAIGALAVIGYCLNVPFLYYFVRNVNSAMAFNSAVLFMLLGIGLVCLSG